MGTGPDEQVNSFDELQLITAVWREHNFPNHTAEEQFEGMVEELGELAHAKRNAGRGIRAHEDHSQKEQDAIGDLIIYLCGYCTRRQLNLFECINGAWEEVRDRDWIKYPGTGRPPSVDDRRGVEQRAFEDPFEIPDDGPPLRP